MARTDGENTCEPSAICKPSPASTSNCRGRCHSQFEYMPRLKPRNVSCIRPYCPWFRRPTRICQPLKLGRIVAFRRFYVSQVRNKPMSSAMTTARFSLDGARIFAVCSLTALAVIGAACGGQEQAAAGAQGAAPPPMPVQVVTLAAQPVEQTTEYVASLKSRRSSTIQP